MVNISLTNYDEEDLEEDLEDNRAHKFRKAQKKFLDPQSKIKGYYSLSELMNMKDLQSINGYTDDSSFKEALSSFLRTNYRKYYALNQESKVSNIYSLLTLLRKENPTISYKNLNFLKSLINEKNYYIEK